MRYRVEHVTAYRYSRPVFIEPHVIKLCPRCDAGQRLAAFNLAVEPEPAGMSDGIDAEGNPFHLVWFNGLAESFKITSAYRVETIKENPFDSFLLSGDFLPIVFSEHEKRVLGPYLDTTDFAASGDDRAIKELANELAGQGESKVFGFLTALNQFLYDRISKTTRLDSGIQPVAETLEKGRGACRDIAFAFMGACRYKGIPSRFVSGCQEGDPELPEGELHAWAEVYLPGFGWKGFDPTHGLAAADRHIAYAASAVPQNTAPVAGSFRGDEAKARMEHAVAITRETQ